jgi:hypothetical protein
MSRTNDRRLLRTLPLACLAAALAAAAGCKGPDPSTFSCTSSRECPGDYHCDLGTASTAGSLKCVSGAPVPRTIAVDPTKFLLVKRSNADGTVRTTITADVGAVTSTPDFVGVRAIASLNGTDLADSPVQANGSVLQFQLPQPLLQVGLRIQDDSTHQVPVTGYHERLELSFLGKDLATNSNGTAAYDAVSVSDSLYPPATWVSTGGAGGTALGEIARTYTVLPDGGFSPPESYQGIETLDGVNISSNVAPQPDRDGGTVIGWEQLTPISTTTNTVVSPPARVGAAMTVSGGNVLMYGGAAPDVDGGIVDPSGTWYSFNPNAAFGSVMGWTAIQQPASGTNPIPSTSFGSPGVSAPSARANAAASVGGTLFCTPSPCAFTTTHRIMVAGGTTSAGALTDHLFAYGNKLQTFAGGSTTWTGWWDMTAEFGGGAANKLPVPNAGMASASLFTIPAPVGASSQPHTGAVLVGGVNIPSGLAATAWDNIGCQIAIGLPLSSSTAGVSGSVANCTTPEFGTALGAIGFRNGVALVPSDQGDPIVYLFGGNRSGATTTTNNGFKNDLWQLSLTAVCSAGGTPPCVAPSVPQLKSTWTQVGVAATPLPPPRANAGLAFADSRRLTVYGGTNAAGNPLTDVWELDLSVLTASPPSTPQWRQVSLDPAPALAPAARTKSTFLGAIGYGNFNTGLLLSGLSGTSPLMDVWALSKQAPSRMLIKAPVNLPLPDAATNVNLGILSFGQIFGAPVYVWDGTAWRFVAGPVFPSGAIFATLPSATGFIQPDGNIYLMYMQPNRSVPGFSATNSTIALDTVQVTLDFN